MFLWRVVLVSAIIACAYCVPFFPNNEANQRPIIGVLDQPSLGESSCNLTSYGEKYLPASYVKLIESAGARVVPIPFDSTRERLAELHSYINALVLPGGDADFTPGTLFYDNAQYLFELSLEANDKGDYFPVIGICQGMEMLTVMMAGSTCAVLDFDYDAQNYSIPLNFTSQARNSELWGNASPVVIDSLATQNITFNAHNNGLPPTKYDNSTSLQKFVTVLSTNVDRNGKEFVSSYEGNDYPIWGLQFHPSRLAYEWRSDEVMNHSIQALQDMQYIAYFLYGQARKSHHRFPTQEAAEEALIYNYAPIYTAPICPTFQQCYFWSTVEY